MSIFRETITSGTVVGRRVLQGPPEPDGPSFWMDTSRRADSGPSTVSVPGFRYQPMRPGPTLYQLLLDDGKRREWVPVDSIIYNHYANGSHLDLSNPYEFLFPKPPPPPTYLKCVVGTLATTPITSYQERELWLWVSAEIKMALERRQGEHTLRITGAHNRGQCPDPSSLWGTIIVSVEFQGQPDLRSITLFDTPRTAPVFDPRPKPPGLVKLRHGQASFDEMTMTGLPRTIELIIADLGI